MRKAMHILLTQMSAKKGFKKHGMKAIDAIFHQFKQFNDGVMPGKPVIAAVNPDDLSRETKNRALEAVNLIKEKGMVRSKDVPAPMAPNNGNMLRTETIFLHPQPPSKQ